MDEPQPGTSPARANKRVQCNAVGKVALKPEAKFQTRRPDRSADLDRRDAWDALQAA